MKIGVIGMGLIGGSMAKAIKEKTEHLVFGWDQSETIRCSAKLAEAVHGILENGDPSDCDLVLIALYPGTTVDYVKKFASKFKKGAMVVDCAGIKRVVCQPLQEVAEENGFIFCGAHPMAGIERSGFTYSTPHLFEGAVMILTPYSGTDIAPMNELSFFFKSLGFARMQVATDVEHDKMIAYTSQLAHVVSSAYIKSELSPRFKGFSAGSFHDMTRVAKLNETMWTELFLDNSDLLADEIDSLIERLQGYSKVIRERNGEKLKAMLKEGKEKRLAIDEVKDFE
ncbi:prephenate dehydrogenase [Anaerotignum sp. MB30-C6]|uniref:prephenate dehydrogenase n=1 Tax=Anaerotignum sp. MB30-C6 TaxID=3070814 RepID=UPI0027DE3636|nr:prephenate dehydrogenase [Anaerotignum sp. MB30-C6]WMI80381.1 prephenate dehydrogenase [Anaerotignum sp. MB30-C6]